MRAARKLAFHRGGFTLLEMVVIIAIILILIMLLIPGVQNAISRAKTIMCLSNMHNLALAHLKYAATHDGLVLDSGSYIGDGGGNIAPANSILIQQGYLGNEVRVFKCPLDKGNRITAYRPDPYKNLSYMRNGSDAFMLNNFKRPTQTALLVEEWEGSPFNDGYIIPGGADYLTQRHPGGKSVMSFVDGHARVIDAIEYNQAPDTWRNYMYLNPP